MPRHDGTGPSGKGPKTGKGLGRCTGAKETDRGVGLGRGLGAGKGQGVGKGRGMGKGLGTGRGMGAGLGRGNQKKGNQ